MKNSLIVDFFNSLSRDDDFIADTDLIDVVAEKMLNDATFRGEIIANIIEKGADKTLVYEVLSDVMVSIVEGIDRVKTMNLQHKKEYLVSIVKHVFSEIEKEN